MERRRKEEEERRRAEEEKRRVERKTINFSSFAEVTPILHGSAHKLWDFLLFLEAIWCLSASQQHLFDVDVALKDTVSGHGEGGLVVGLGNLRGVL